MAARKARSNLALLLGGLAALLATLYLLRARLSRGNASVAPADPWSPENAPDEVAAPEPARDEAPNQALAESLRTESATPEVGAGGGLPAEAEPWMESLRQVMDQVPHDFGYGKSAWTAPLLSRYLSDTQGYEVPVPRLRQALKDLGYRWDQTHYVQSRSLQR